MTSHLLNILRLFKRTFLDGPSLLRGFLRYQRSKETPEKAFQSLINLFCLTGGISNEILSLPVRFCNRPYSIGKPEGVLGDISSSQAHINNTLKNDGYYVFEKKLSEETCEHLLNFANTTPARLRGDHIHNDETAFYQPEDVKAVRYDYDLQSLLCDHTVQNILSDKSIIAVAQNYLGSKPILDVLTMWWHTAFQKAPDESSAQLFHFDMDRIKWLKFFIYLTDVGEENGPHVFVKGSHRNRGIPSKLRAKGYARLTDEEVAACYSSQDIIHHYAPKGTIIAEDTRGLHKGQPVIKGDRLVLQLQFSNHLFGATYPKHHFGEITDVLRQSMLKYPKVYQNYLPENLAI